MSLKDLSKEQKQYVVLGVLAAVILVVLLVIGIKVSLSSITKAKKELKILTEKIEAADRTLSRRSKVNADFRRTMGVLEKQLNNAPPERNYYSWATEVIYSSARQAGLEIDTVDEIAGAGSKAGAAGQDTIRLESYALRITSHGGFNNVKQFIGDIRDKYPLVRFTGIDVSKGNDPENHNVQMFMQWPFNLGAIAKNWESVESKQRALDLQEQEENLDVEPGTEPVATETPREPVVASAPTNRTSVPEAKPVPVQESVKRPERVAPVKAPVVAKKMPTPPPPREEVEPEPVVIPVAPEEPPMEVASENTAVLAPESVEDVVPEQVAAVVEPEPDLPEPGVEIPVTEPEPEVVTTVEPPIAEPEPEPVAVAPVAEPVTTKTEDAAPEAAVAETDTPAATAEGEAEKPDALYVTTEKSARKLKALLKSNDRPVSGSLGALLDDLMENNDEEK